MDEGKILSKRICGGALTSMKRDVLTFIALRSVVFPFKKHVTKFWYGKKCIKTVINVIIKWYGTSHENLVSSDSGKQYATSRPIFYEQVMDSSSSDFSPSSDYSESSYFSSESSSSSSAPGPKSASVTKKGSIVKSTSTTSPTTKVNSSSIWNTTKATNYGILEGIRYIQLLHFQNMLSVPGFVYHACFMTSLMANSVADSLEFKKKKSVRWKPPSSHVYLVPNYDRLNN